MAEACRLFSGQMGTVQSMAHHWSSVVDAWDERLSWFSLDAKLPKKLIRLLPPRIFASPKSGGATPEGTRWTRPQKYHHRLDRFPRIPLADRLVDCSWQPSWTTALTMTDAGPYSSRAGKAATVAHAQASKPSSITVDVSMSRTV